MLALAVLLLIPLIWGMVAGRLARWSITAPIAMVAAGVALTAGSNPLYVIDLDTSIVEHFVEVVLAVVLFVDATEVEGGFFGTEPKLTARLLLIALPLSLAFAVAFGALTFPHQSFWILAVIATVVMPTDLAPVVSLIRDRRVPSRLRDLLNVESGFNDGFIAPLFLFAVAAAHTASDESIPDLEALIEAAPAFLIAIAAGAAVGFGGGWLISRAYSRGWTEPPALRIAVLMLALVAYLVAVGLKGNGFVAAFVAGLLFRPAAQRLPKDALHLVEDVGVLLGLLVWFLFGELINQTLEDGTDWAIVLFAVLAVTVARTLPVVLSLSRTTIDRADRWFLGWVSPRGLASIAFGLLAYIELGPPENELVGEIMVITVLVSVLVHGASVVPLATAYGRRTTTTPTAPSPRDDADRPDSPSPASKSTRPETPT
ncbi:MAG: cation:proton antiporter [Lapillicoccus sp.]